MIQYRSRFSLWYGFNVVYAKGNIFFDILFMDRVFYQILNEYKKKGISFTRLIHTHTHPQSMKYSQYTYFIYSCVFDNWVVLYFSQIGIGWLVHKTFYRSSGSSVFGRGIVHVCVWEMTPTNTAKLTRKKKKSIYWEI